MFCKKKHFCVYWTKVRWYYLGSSLTSLLDPDGQLRGHIGKWYEITASRLSVTVPQPEHDGFKQHLWVKLESWWHSASHSEAAFQCHLLCSNVQWNHSLNGCVQKQRAALCFFLSYKHRDRKRPSAELLLIKLHMCESFPTFPSASQLYTIKRNSSLFVALKMKAVNVSPHPPWASTFSFLLAASELEPLWLNVSSATNTNPVVFHAYCSSHPSHEDFGDKGDVPLETIILLLDKCKHACKLHRDQVVDPDSDLLAVNNCNTVLPC